MAQISSHRQLWCKPLAAIVLLAISQVAVAQWQWVDNTGRKVFSDTPPPAGIPDKNVLQRPGARAPVAPPAEPGEEAASAAAPAAPKPPARDEQLEARKRQAEAAEEAKKKADDARVAKLRAENCERAQRAKATMDSGVRIATTNAKGEREIMDDAARAAETRRLSDIMQRDCGGAPAQQAQ
ncbi:DUF4124 domain-containing protein [Hydrogenophaga sp.]|uniref:DUF4124 domain-containing protein n=1 Tax=Hydrogenophaga sp. TaxID=1904254 RepID=UPI0027202FAA|nr:DUF4124 domain-containing protein [Hydrogenophaga sp.]MDO8904513.1 DUF4124 domain-containing protein [Hydrogenophaga sp.]